MFLLTFLQKFLPKAVKELSQVINLFHNTFIHLPNLRKLLLLFFLIHNNSFSFSLNFFLIFCTLSSLFITLFLFSRSLWLSFTLKTSSPWASFYCYHGSYHIMKSSIFPFHKSYFAVEFMELRSFAQLHFLYNILETIYYRIPYHDHF